MGAMIDLVNRVEVVEPKTPPPTRQRVLMLHSQQGFAHVPR